jgi:hypothetical protein
MADSGPIARLPPYATPYATFLEEILHLSNARKHLLLGRLIFDLNDDRGSHHGASNATLDANAKLERTRLEDKIATDTALCLRVGPPLSAMHASLHWQ